MIQRRKSTRQIVSPVARPLALTCWGPTVGRTTTMRERVRFNGPNIRIGGMSWIQHDEMIDDHVTISDHVVTGPGRGSQRQPPHRERQAGSAKFTEPVLSSRAKWG